jgi:subtilisin family serine protease
MATNVLPPARPSARVTVHPAPLNVLTEIFDRRNIAVGIDSSGQVVLARPDSVLAEIKGDEQRESLAKYVERYDKEQAEAIRKSGEEKGQPFVVVRLPAGEREAVNGEDRWTFSAVHRAMRELAALDAPIQSELNHVFLGAQVVRGNPLGSPASWAGEMAFLGNVVETKPDAEGVVRKVMLSTAEPAEEPNFLRRRLNIKGRRRPQILVLDTGLQTVVDDGTRRPAHRLLECCQLHAAWRDRPAGATGPVPIDDEDEPDDDATRTLDFEGGHGTFIAGVIAQLCPDAEVYTSGVLSSFGDGDVADVIAGLRAGLGYSRTGIDIVVMSFGAFFADDDPGLFAKALRRLLRGKLGIAAAGNQATCRPYFPAGMHDVIGVGAVSAAGRAWFSNFGGWVDACAPGVDVVSTFFDFGEDLALFPDLEDLKPRRYNGWARWSGTSFSAPKVAAVVAQEMYLNLDEDGSGLISAHDAWHRLTTHDRLRVPDLGVAFNV